MFLKKSMLPEGFQFSKKNSGLSFEGRLEISQRVFVKISWRLSSGISQKYDLFYFHNFLLGYFKKVHPEFNQKKIP